jgi:hypothetical protein
MKAFALSWLCLGAAYLFMSGPQVPRLLGVQQPKARYLVSAFAFSFWALVFLLGKISGSMLWMFIGLIPAWFGAFLLLFVVPKLRNPWFQLGTAAVLLAAGVTLALLRP